MLKTIYLPNFLPVNTIKINRTPSYYLFVGRLSKEKGVSSLITTFAKFSHEKLVIIGDGPEKDSLIKLTERLGLSNRVTFLGKVSHSNLQFYYSKAYALVVPSIWKENNPLVILESLSVGIPVIATSRGGLLDFAKNGAACFNYNTESELIKLLKYVKSYNRLVTLPEIYSESVHLERLVSIYSSFS
jgi:glycosyltransferase involved in cell wall biosynthesis